jgi:hypothetical protein
MYKNKYLKYKKKYLNLIGGLPITNIDITNKEHFLEYYRTYAGQSSYEILFNLLPFIDKPMNILVGCGNFNDNDFFRFNNSPYYSLYIETNDNYEHINRSNQLDINKQYEMYTIFNEEIDKIKLLPKNFIDNIHLDLMVSYFCPRDDYLNLIRKSLKKGGKFIFQYLERSGAPYFVRNNIIKDVYNKVIDISIFSDVIIDHSSYNIYIPDDKIQQFFNKRQLLSPQCGFILRNMENNYRYKSNIIGQYHKYLINILPEFVVELKTFNYQNYTYPVPIKINLDNSLEIWNSSNAKFIINDVMTVAGRDEYIATPILSDIKIQKLFEKSTKPEYQKIYREKLGRDYNYEELQGLFYEEIFSENYYFEITKL